MEVWRALAVVVGCSTAVATADRESYNALARQVEALRYSHRRLALEEACAASDSVYVVLDLDRGEVAVRMAGVPLRSAPLAWIDATSRGRSVLDTSTVAERTDLGGEAVADTVDSLGAGAAAGKGDSLTSGAAIGKSDSLAAGLAVGQGDSLVAGAGGDSLAAEHPTPICLLTLKSGLRLKIAGAPAPTGSWAYVVVKARSWLLRLVRRPTAADVHVSVPTEAFEWVRTAAAPGVQVLVVTPGPAVGPVTVTPPQPASLDARPGRSRSAPVVDPRQGGG